MSIDMRPDMPREGGERSEYHEVIALYDRERPLFEAALHIAKLAIAEIKKQHENDASLRICYFGGRVKSLYSIVRKAISKGLSAARVFNEIGDAVGLRVVVANLKDVDPLIEALISHPGLRVVRKEMFSAPTEYRATHLDVVWSWKDANGSHEIKCEIQIRTLLQDAWAIMSHREFYKNTAPLPELAQTISEHLSESLYSADRLADQLRSTLESRVTTPSGLADVDSLDADGIAFLYYETFGMNPQQYELDYLVKCTARHAVATIGDARRGLTKVVLGKLTTIHSTRFWTPLSSIDAFEYGLSFVATGEQAFADFRARVERDWAEVEAIARNETLAELPDTLEELEENVANGVLPWNALRELGAVKKCLRCGSEYLDVDAAVEVLGEHYDSEYRLENILAYLANTDSPESIDHPGLCAYCGSMCGEDD